MDPVLMNLEIVLAIVRVRLGILEQTARKESFHFSLGL